MKKSQSVYDELVRVIVETWEVIVQDYIDGLIKSIDNRVNVVLETKG